MADRVMSLDAWVDANPPPADREAFGDWQRALVEHSRALVADGRGDLETHQWLEQYAAMYAEAIDAYRTLRAERIAARRAVIEQRRRRNERRQRR